MKGLLRTKTIEEVEPKILVSNSESVNPYVRRYGSHVKSHFSQSRCEFFESSEDETQLKISPENNVNSLNHIENIEAHGSKFVNKSLNNIKNELKAEQIIKEQNPPSIDGNNSKENLQITPQKTLKRKDSLEMELDEEDDEWDNRSELIIRSHKSSISNDSFDSQLGDLGEPGTILQPKALYISKEVKLEESSPLPEAKLSEEKDKCEKLVNEEEETPQSNLEEQDQK